MCFNLEECIVWWKLRNEKLNVRNLPNQLREILLYTKGKIWVMVKSVGKFAWALQLLPVSKLQIVQKLNLFELWAVFCNKFVDTLVKSMVVIFLFFIKDIFLCQHSGLMLLIFQSCLPSLLFHLWPWLNMWTAVENINVVQIVCQWSILLKNKKEKNKLFLIHFGKLVCVNEL